MPLSGYSNQGRSRQNGFGGGGEGCRRTDHDLFSRLRLVTFRIDDLKGKNLQVKEMKYYGLRDVVVTGT